MTIIQTLFLASALLISPAAESNGTEPAASSAESYTELTGTIRELVDYPEFAREPNQEMIVTVRFRVDDDSRIDLVEVTGSNEHMNDYVADHLSGKTVDVNPVLQNATYQTTLRFVW